MTDPESPPNSLPLEHRVRITDVIICHFSEMPEEPSSATFTIGKDGKFTTSQSMLPSVVLWNMLRPIGQAALLERYFAERQPFVTNLNILMDFSKARTYDNLKVYLGSLPSVPVCFKQVFDIVQHFRSTYQVDLLQAVPRSG